MSYTTPELIQAELRADTAFGSATTPSLASVNTWIEQTDSYIDGIANKVYAVSSYTDTFHNGGELLLFLKNTPLVSVTSVEYNNSIVGVAPNWVTLTEYTNYSFDADKGVIILVAGSFTVAPGYNKYRVTYNSGYTVLPKNVEMLATKLVTSRVLSGIISQNVNERNAGGSISVGDISIVEPADYGVGSYKQLKNDIKDLESDITSGFQVYRYG